MWMLLATLTACGGPNAVPAPSATATVASYDHSYKALNAVYDGVISQRGVDYTTLRTRKAALDAVVADLGSVDASAFSEDQQVAFWANAYNAITLKLIVDNPGIDSITKLDDGEVWKTRTWSVAGESITLDTIEHGKLRPLTDGRVHAIISCASKGCPPLGRYPIAAENLDQQLDAAAHRWVQANAWRQSGDTLYLSEIFKWFPEDFQRWRQAAVPGANEAQTRAVWFIAAHADNNVGRRVTAGALKVEWEPYDWSLNQAAIE